MKEPTKAKGDDESKRTIQVTFHVNRSENAKLIALFGKHKRGKQLIRDTLLRPNSRPKSQAAHENALEQARVHADLHSLARWVAKGDHNGTPIECAQVSIALAKLAERLHHGH